MTTTTNNLIKIETNQEGVQAVSGRELHEFLRVRTPYNKWIARMIEYGFEEGQDFRTKMSESTGGRSATDHILKLDVAKEICMIQRSERGKQARLYFIECERQLQLVDIDSYAIVDPVARAQRWIEEEQERQRLAQIALQLEAAQPLIDFAEMILDAGDTMDMQQVASIIAQRGYGRTNLFRLLKAEGVLIDSKRPYQRQVDAGRFKVVERPFRIAERDEVRISRKIVVTQKGLQYIQQLVNADIRRRNEERASQGA